jgi:cell division protease FtsH
MKTLLAISKERAQSAGRIELEHVLAACAYVRPVTEFVGRRIMTALGASKGFATVSAAESQEIFRRSKALQKKIALSEDVRVFISHFGGIDTKLTSLLDQDDPTGTGVPKNNDIDESASPNSSTEAHVMQRLESEVTSRLPSSQQESNGASPASPAINNVRVQVRAVVGQLSAIVIGQDTAVASLARLTSQFAIRLEKQRAPQAVFFLAGPPATGKTLTASLLAQVLGDEWKTLFIDMARMQSDDTSGAWLVGLRQPYAGAGPGQLTQAVQEHPRTVVVFDNFHAAHPRVQDALLPVFDSGFLRDDYTQKEVDFRQTVLVFTSNLGAGIFARPDFLGMVRENPVAAEHTFLEAIANETTLRNGNPLPVVSPELLSRLSRSTILLFSPLPFAALLEISRKAVTEEITRIEQTFGCRVAPLEDALLQAHLLALSPQVDARRASSALARNLFAPLEDALLEAESAPTEVRFVLDAPVVETLARWATDTGLDELRRKQRGMSLIAATQREEALLTITWRGGDIRRVARSVDFDGPGAIRIEVPEIAFDKIAGHDRIKARLSEVAELLRQPDTLKNYGAYPSRGMLLHGRPGTGKTMMAKAFANYCDLPFIATTGSELLNVAFLRRVFKRAREYAPAIVFVDEIDALGRRDMSGYTEPINELLAAIDGFDTHANAHLFVIAATNYPHRVDPALLRAGRIDMHVELPAPDRGARAFFIDQIIQRLQGDVDRERLLDISAGLTGAELERVKRESALLAMREGIPAKLTEKHVVEAIYLVKHGERYARPMRTEREQVAYHEAGHAVCSAVLNPDQRIEQVSIVARGDTAGFVSFIQDEENSHITVREVREAIAVRLAGRVAEIIACNGEEGIDAGAESDLLSATALCRRAIARWGMDEKFGLVHIDAINEAGDPQVCSLLNERIRVWLEEGRAMAEKVLQDHWPQVVAVNQALQRDEILDGDRLRELLPVPLSRQT